MKLRNPLREYYVVENYGTYDPSTGAATRGSWSYDGNTYRLSSAPRPNPLGDDWQTYYAVRTVKRTSGTVNMAAILAGWRNAGLIIGMHDYQIFATEGYFSSGYSNMTIAGLSVSTSPTPTAVSKLFPLLRPEVVAWSSALMRYIS
jgi:endo-1,4-beta-xylanase